MTSLKEQEQHSHKHYCEKHSIRRQVEEKEIVHTPNDLIKQ